MEVHPVSTHLWDLGHSCVWSPKALDAMEGYRADAETDALAIRETSRISPKVSRNPTQNHITSAASCKHRN